MEICGQVVRLVAGQRLPEGDDLKLERAMIESEVRAVVAKVLEMGEGDCRGGRVPRIPGRRDRHDVLARTATSRER
jgi:glutamate mutase epsilon subunit